jgi:membrane protease YdiL (CAAX protease family)
MPAPELLPQWSPAVATVAVVLGVALGLGAQAVVLAVTDSRAIAVASIAGVELVLLATVLIAAGGDARQPPLDAAAFGLRRTPAGSALARCVGLLVCYWIAALAFNAVFGTGPEHGRHARGAFAPGIAVLVVLGAAVVGPIVEEVAFRGYLFPALANRRGDTTGAVLTALVFAVAHVLAKPLVLLPATAVFGYGTCMLRLGTRSILPGVALHAFVNALALAVLTKGQLLWALPVAPVLSLALLWPLSGPRA